MMPPKVVLISGKQGSGKSTLAAGLQSLYLFSVVWKFADPLYEMHDKVLDVLEKHDVNLARPQKKLLQLLGTEWGREILGKNVWVNIMQNRVKDFIGPRLIIIDDCRFKNEFIAFPHALSVRLECSEEIRKKRTTCWRDNADHPSETDLDGYAGAGMFKRIIDTGVHDDPNFVLKLVSHDIDEMVKTEMGL